MRFWLALPIIALLGGSLAAKPRKPSYFLAGDPHVPLATVDQGRIRSAVTTKARGKTCGSRARWASIGSSWRALDEWGQLIATRKVAALDDYDVTACAELSFTTNPDTRIYVSADSAWRPSTSAEWKPSTTEHADFEKLLATQLPAGNTPSNTIPGQCTAIADAIRFFDSGAKGRFAVGTSNTGYIVAKLDTRGWSVSSKSTTAPAAGLCYRPVAVFDMNDDRTPEIILRESEGTSWGDFVLELDAKGNYVIRAESPGGATA